MASRKVNFALAVRDAVTALAEAAERIAELDEIYEASGYAPSWGNPIVDDDISGHDITATDLANASTFAANLALFLNDGMPLQFNYAGAIASFRGM